MRQAELLCSASSDYGGGVMSDYRLENVFDWLHIIGPQWRVATQDLKALHSKREQIIKLVKEGPNEVIDYGDHYALKGFELYVFVSNIEGHDSFAWIKSGACRLQLPLDIAHMIVDKLEISEAKMCEPYGRDQEPYPKPKKPKPKS